MPPVSDPLLPALEELLGPGAGALLTTIVEAGGGTLDGYDRRQVLYRPGDRAAVRYSVHVRWGASDPVTETVVAVTTVDGPPDGTLLLSAGDLAVGLFRYPHDPALPGLPIATVADRLDRWLEVGDGAGPALEVRTYRPTRRAVVHARWRGLEDATSERELYVKCVPPDEVAAIQERLAMLRAHAPVPVVAAMSSESGLLALEALPGRTIREVLRAGDPTALAALPNGRAILSLLDGLPAPAAAMGPARPGPIERAPDHGALLSAVLPRLAPRVDRLLATLDGPDPGSPDAVVHGDLYEAQVLVDETGVSGLLDLDGAGPGRRTDDLATFLAHLAVLAETLPRRRAAIERYRASLQVAFEDVAGRAPLTRATAAVIVGLATGPFRVQQSGWPSQVEGRLALAETWAAAA
jgi:aminoglycoside phosphotransferase